MNTSFMPPAPQVVYVRPESRGMAIAALSMGVVGSIIGLIPLFGLVALPLGILALIFGLVATSKAKRLGLPKGMARAGWILGVLAIVLGVAGMAIVNGAVNELEHDLNQLEMELEG